MGYAATARTGRDGEVGGKVGGWSPAWTGGSSTRRCFGLSAEVLAVPTASRRGKEAFPRFAFASRAGWMGGSVDIALQSARLEGVIPSRIWLSGFGSGGCASAGAYRPAENSPGAIEPLRLAACDWPVLIVVGIIVHAELGTARLIRFKVNNVGSGGLRATILHRLSARRFGYGRSSAAASCGGRYVDAHDAGNAHMGRSSGIAPKAKRDESE